MNWSLVFNTEHFSIGIRFEVIYEVVKASKYPYYCFNGLVYESATKRVTGYTSKDL